MFLGFSPDTDLTIYRSRRQELKERIRDHHPKVKKGALLLLAGFEQESRRFRQDSSFFYLTGINEPAVALLMNFDGKTTLFAPQFERERMTWVIDELASVKENPADFGIDEICPMGAPMSGFQSGMWAPAEAYGSLIDELKNITAQEGSIFTITPGSMHDNAEQRLGLERMYSWVDHLREATIDISREVARMRRRKDMAELEKIYQAVEMTSLAQQAAGSAIAHNVDECEIHGQIDYMFISMGGDAAFPTIVASGPQATILHYQANCRTMQNGELVIVDCGAINDHYCADVSRTYPVSKKFSEHQRKLYDSVLEVQEYVADIARPGFWLNNPKEPAKSLNHIARELFKKKGLDSFVVHGLGHFLGLDVHDVGDATEPLEEGDIITLEPGIYLPEEKIGIRIEDDYWMTKTGLICLSESLPKKADEIEALMEGNNDENEEGAEEDEHECGCDCEHECNDCFEEQ